MDVPGDEAAPNIFDVVNKYVTEALRKDEDRKINYILTGEIPEEFKCPDCLAQRTKMKGIDCKTDNASDLVTELISPGVREALISKLIKGEVNE